MQVDRGAVGDRAETAKAVHPASTNAYDEVFREMKNMRVAADANTDNACPGEFETIKKDVSGVPTAVLKQTKYGDYLDQLKDDSLKDAPPSTPPTLNEQQQEIATQALAATLKLLDSQPGSAQWRQAVRELDHAFSGNRAAANPELRAQYFKDITDYLSTELAKTNPNVRFGTSLLSGAVVVGYKDGGKWSTFRELRNESVCPANPYQ